MEYFFVTIPSQDIGAHLIFEMDNVCGPYWSKYGKYLAFPYSKQGLEESGEDVSQGKYGVAQMNQSREKPEFRFIEDFSILTEKLDNQIVWIRARLHTSRAKGTLLRK